MERARLILDQRHWFGNIALGSTSFSSQLYSLAMSIFGSEWALLEKCYLFSAPLWSTPLNGCASVGIAPCSIISCVNRLRCQWRAQLYIQVHGVKNYLNEHSSALHIVSHCFCLCYVHSRFRSTCLSFL